LPVKDSILQELSKKYYSGHILETLVAWRVCLLRPPVDKSARDNLFSFLALGLKKCNDPT